MSYGVDAATYLAIVTGETAGLAGWAWTEPRVVLAAAPEG